jgi:hypothetical protein
VRVVAGIWSHLTLSVLDYDAFHHLFLLDALLVLVHLVDHLNGLLGATLRSDLLSGSVVGALVARTLVLEGFTRGVKFQRQFDILFWGLFHHVLVSRAVLVEVDV